MSLDIGNGSVRLNIRFPLSNLLWLPGFDPYTFFGKSPESTADDNSMLEIKVVLKFAVSAAKPWAETP
jgi:hypothetical protein